MSTTMIPPGYVINQRYVIRRSLGSSPTSVVYEAEDTSLQRPVAIRVLAADLVANEEWRQYIRHETTAVAALHHPNLTRIYDWGEEGGSIYIVTEFLGGGSLRDVLGLRGQLSLEQTTLIGLEAATALAYAHARGFVHGALTPSNILFDDEGRVRVSDLALATTQRRAAGSPLSLDDARYLSPEQVLGEPAEARSDVYALSLILFEALTGHVAHAGRTLETTRTNRLGAPLPHRPELGPLDLVLALGAAPETGARPDAALFASRLASVAATLPVPRPVTLGPGRLGGFVVPTAEDVLSAPAIAVSGRAFVDEQGTGEVVRPFDLPGYRESVETSRPAPPARSARTGRTAAVLTLIVVIILGVGLATAWKLGVFVPSYQVPPLVGLTPLAAEKLVASDNFTVRIVSTTTSSSIAAGEIIHQSPASGASLRQGSAIRVMTSSGPATTALPAVIGLGCDAAITQLTDVGLSGTCSTSHQVYSPTARPGAVVTVLSGPSVNPAQVPAGSTVTLVTSKGPNPATTSTTTTTVATTGLRPVPDVVGKDSSQTKSLMHQALLYYNTTGPGSSNGTWTTVVSTSPPPGTMVKAYSTIIVTVR